MGSIRPLLFILVLPALLFGQSTVQASGSATVRVTPDQAQMTVSIVTQANTAQEAGQQNATIAATVIAALQTVLTTNGTVQTVGYSVSPRYGVNSTSIIGYSATNTVQVTTNDIALVGKLIDTANQAGASSVSGISFGLQDPEPAKQQALGKAAQQAAAHAAAIAGGLSRRVGSVVSAIEGVTYAPVVAGDSGGAASSTPTPVQSGSVSVYATVTVTFALQ